MRKLAAVLCAGILAATPLVTSAAQAQTITQTQQANSDLYTPGFYIVGGIALVGVALGILALVEEPSHHHHHQQPVSP